MSFQKCPVCEGLGRELLPPVFDGNRFVSAAVSMPCQTCQGKRIIHSVTGLPPQNQPEPLPQTPPALQELKPEEIVSPLSVLDEYSDDEILYWSTPYFDELQAKKALRAQQIKDKEDL